MLRRKSFISVAVVLSAAALGVGLYAGTAVASPTGCSGNTCTWGGQGATNGSLDNAECDAANDPNGANQPYLLWIFTEGGGSVSSATLTLGGSGSGNYVGTAYGKEFHFVTPYFTPDTSTLTASVTFVGSIGNAQLVISHGCAGATDTTPPTCVLTDYTTYPNSSEKSSITVTLQDSGSGITNVVTSGTNANVTPSTTFNPPTIAPVTVTATKITQGAGATLKIEVTDAAGNQEMCDPVLRKGRHVTAHGRTRQRLGATVQAAGLKLHINSTALTYGAAKPVTLSGRLRNAPAGTAVTILSQGVGFMGLSPIATATTGAGGTFSYRFHPAVGALYAVSANGVISPSVKIRVQPLVQLTRTAPGHYRVDATTTNPLFLTGAKVLLQERRGQRWVTIAKTRLAKNSTATEPTVVSSGAFATSKGVDHRLRATVAGTGWYVRGVSTTIRG